MESAADTSIDRPAPRPRREGSVAPDGHPHRRIARAMILPGVILLLLLVLFPVVMEIYISLTNWTPTTGTQWYRAYQEWSWFDNYWDGITSPSFLAAALRTIVMTVAATGVEFVLGFGLALLFLNKFVGRGIATVLFLLPMMIVPAVSGFVFLLLLRTDGPINSIISAVVPGTFEARWLTDPTLAPIAVVLVDVWQWTPLMFLILLAGLMARSRGPDPGGRHPRRVLGPEAPPRRAADRQADHPDRAHHPRHGGIQDLRRRLAPDPGRAR